MKKSLIFAGMLAVGYANAQYEGKVGVNTETPKATLEVQPTATNLTGTTNEGIIAPKLSKERIAAIATPVEGTLVYATDATYAGSDVKVAKITEKGYYFYNGTEWVKAGADATSQIWQKQSDKSILLVDEDIKASVKYSPTGDYTSIPKTLRQYSKRDNNNVVTEDFNPENSNEINSRSLNIAYADEVRETFIHPSSKEKQLMFNHFLVDDKSTTSRIDRYFTQKNLLEVTNASTRNYPSLYSTINSAEYFGKGRVTFALMGAYNTSTLHSGSAARVVGSYNQATTFVSTDLPYLEATYSLISARGTGKINQAYATRSHMILNNLSANAMNEVALTRNHLEVLENTAPTATMESLSGMSTYFQIPSTYTGIKNQYGVNIVSVVNGQESNYGLRIGDVGNTTATDNYSIHTGAGQIRFGDLKGTGNRPVYANADGKLIIGDATNAATSFKWVEDATNTSVKLAVNSAGTDRTTAPVSITDTGMVKATSFQGSNGATIFPDYVFQKYYDGVSDIKADYTFKTLSQVEDFVKANGHLPGYKSAAEIKNQGYIDLMETQLTNVEKIEELYLHSIEQEKVNKTQAEELKAKDAKIQELEARLEKLEKLLK